MDLDVRDCFGREKKVLEEKKTTPQKLSYPSLIFSSPFALPPTSMYMVMATLPHAKILPSKIVCDGQGAVRQAIP